MVDTQKNIGYSLTKVDSYVLAADMLNDQVAQSLETTQTLVKDIRETNLETTNNLKNAVRYLVSRIVKFFENFFTLPPL